MYEQIGARQQRLAYEKLLYRYSIALENGDFESIIAILKMAENDPYLEQMIIEAHSEGYQQEEDEMQQNTSGSHVNDTQSDITASLPEPLRGQVHKPRRPWLVGLERLVAILLVIMLIVGALLLFTPRHPQTTGRSSSTGAHVEVTPTAAVVGTVVTMGEQALSARNVDTGDLLWQIPAPETLNLNDPVGLTIDNQIIYLAYARQVWAFKLKDGKQLWHQVLGTADSAMVIGDSLPRLVVEQHIVYASGYSGGALYALNAQTGAILWSYDAPIPALLTVSNGIAYVLGNGDNVHNAVKALKGQSGQVLWSYDTTMPLSATVDDDTLYVQSSHDYTGDPTGGNKEQKPLFALNASTGEKIWSIVAPANGPSPLVVAQGIIVLFDGNHFCGYQTSNGNPVWCTTGPENDINGSGLLSVDGTVYGLYSASFTETLVEAINPQNGQIDWSQNISLTVGNSPQILSQENSLILSSWGGMVLNRTNGTLLWNLPGNTLATAVSD